MGDKICVKVQPVTPSGFRGLKYTLTAIVSPPAAAGSGEGDEENTDATLKVGLVTTHRALKGKAILEARKPRRAG